MSASAKMSDRERAIHQNALRRTYGKPRERMGLSEDAWIPQAAEPQQQALNRAVQGMLREHRRELDELRERLERVDKGAA